MDTDKIKFIISIIMCIVFFGLTWVFGVFLMRAVFQYPFLRKSQNIVFPQITSSDSGRLLTEYSTDLAFSNSTSMTINTSTQLQDVKIVFNTTGTDPTYICSIYAGSLNDYITNQNNFPQGEAELLHDFTVTKSTYQNPDGTFTYTGHYPVQSLNKNTPPLKTLTGETIITYIIHTSDKSQVLFGLNYPIWTKQPYNTLFFNMSCVQMTLVNQKIDKNKIFETVGMVFLLLSTLYFSYIMYKYLNNNNTFTSNAYGSKIFSSFLVILGFIVYGLLNIIGVVSSGIMVNHGHVGEFVENVGVFWVLFSYVVSFISFINIIY